MHKHADLDPSGSPAAPSHGSIASAKRLSGLFLSWAKDKKMNLINARADTLFVKPAFRASAKRRRCLILADGYYEWKSFSPKKKQPYYLRPKDDRPIAFVGIWDCWKGEAVPIESCSIITTDANELPRPIHDRMRVIVRGADAEAWIDPGTDDPKALGSLLRPFSAEEMSAFPISSRMGKVGENDAGMIEPAIVN